MKTLLVMISFIGLASSASAMEFKWYHAGPFFNNSVSVLLDFQWIYAELDGGLSSSYGPGSYQYKAHPMWVNVNRQGLSPSDHVRVMLISYINSCYRGRCEGYESVKEYELQYAQAGRFTVHVDPLELVYQFNDGYALTRREVVSLDLVVWINGEIIKDPITQKNFNANLLEIINVR